MTWTAEEYKAAPEMARRLHTRILDLQDALESVLPLLARAESELSDEGYAVLSRELYDQYQSISKVLGEP